MRIAIGSASLLVSASVLSQPLPQLRPRKRTKPAPARQRMPAATSRRRGVSWADRAVRCLRVLPVSRPTGWSRDSVARKPAAGCRGKCTRVGRAGSPTERISWRTVPRPSACAAAFRIPTRASVLTTCARFPAPPGGENDFVDNGDGTVSDRASGLMWQQTDDGRPQDWPSALAYCANLKLAQHDDWRFPNVKELQSIVDYRRSDPAIDERFLRQTDRRGWFWSSTTYGDNVTQADYVCFGKCTSADGVDVHGAGAQRADPKRRGLTDRISQGGRTTRCGSTITSVACVRTMAPRSRCPDRISTRRND